ncbi:hypothetical protein ADL03_21300 [Nocardia sp. NRRL S-836]|nr:hypothetical protein ADL03_21300 [Nocardia sp. NRRL S-836]
MGQMRTNCEGLLLVGHRQSRRVVRESQYAGTRIVHAAAELALRGYASHAAFDGLIRAEPALRAGEDPHRG